MQANESLPPRTAEARVKQRRRRVIAATLVPAAAALSVLFGVEASIGGRLWTKGPGPFSFATMDPTFAIIFSAVIAITLIVAAIWHHRAIDEQDERAYFWGNTVGLYCFCVMGMSADALTAARLIPQLSHTSIFMMCMAPALATYLWLKYR